LIIKKEKNSAVQIKVEKKEIIRMYGGNIHFCYSVTIQQLNLPFFSSSIVQRE